MFKSIIQITEFNNLSGLEILLLKGAGEVF
jgi:hypothetical protein